MGGEFVQIGLAEDDGPGGAQAATATASAFAGAAWVNRGLATVVGKPRTSILSLITRGMPWSGPLKEP